MARLSSVTYNVDWPSLLAKLVCYILHITYYIDDSIYLPMCKCIYRRFRHHCLRYLIHELLVLQKMKMGRGDQNPGVPRGGQVLVYLAVLLWKEK